MTHIRPLHVLVAAAVAGLFVVGVAAQTAQPAPPGPRGQRMGPPPGAGVGPMLRLRGLDLTEPQRDQFRALMEERRAADNPAATRVRELQRALNLQLFSDAPDQGAIEQIKIDLAQAHQQALAERIAFEAKIAQILTPEQRKTLRERIEEGPGPGMWRRGPGARRGAGIGR